MLQIPYDILNRLNRKKLKSENEDVVGSVVVDDYLLKNPQIIVWIIFVLLPSSRKNKPLFF